MLEELYHNFKEQTARLDRQTDENVFQQLRGRYERQLQQQLSGEAKELMYAYKRNDILHLQHLLTESIAYYLSEFRTKAGST
ncbi:hypothetical protein LQ567_04925 [Niabella pedocola]|uniref:Uncharacterized protein n=1 Tax=Niabella pedocola TaxID=1752077 RepID=A0ABS8PLW2_9BACT|nr:hypothetical protein [Niabella pedocola]MCD2422094.1 hypothetical protein [Niabella pedocola]